MLSSEVIVAMYSLEIDAYIQRQHDDEKEDVLLNAHETVKFLLSVEAGIRQLVSNTHKHNEDGVDLQFAVVLIGISKGPLTPRLRIRNAKIFAALQSQCKHLKFEFYPVNADGDNCMYHINYREKQVPMSTMVQILHSIYQTKKSALANGYIRDSRVCCGLFKVPNSSIYNVSSTLAEIIKRQPFVLRKIQQHNTIRIKHESHAHREMPQYSKSGGGVALYVQKLQGRDMRRQVVGGPIASVHHWKLSRPKTTIFVRTLGCLLSGVFFPFLVVMQTVMFWCYCAEWGISDEGLSRLVINHRISQYGTYLLDFLYPLFPRMQPDPAVESAINTGLRSLLNEKKGSKGEYKIDWFFRQTKFRAITSNVSY